MKRSLNLVSTQTDKIEETKNVTKSWCIGFFRQADINLTNSGIGISSFNERDKELKLKKLISQNDFIVGNNNKKIPFKRVDSIETSNTD